MSVQELRTFFSLVAKQSKAPSPPVLSAHICSKLPFLAVANAWLAFCLGLRLAFLVWVKDRIGLLKNHPLYLPTESEL